MASASEHEILPQYGRASLWTRIVLPVQFLGFWTAVVSPFVLLGLIVAGLALQYPLVLTGLLAANVAGIVLGNGYNARV
jgi:hypothetical protein